MKVVLFALLISALAGCAELTSDVLTSTEAAENLYQIALNRNLAGESSERLSFFAGNSSFGTRWAGLSDLASFSRESGDEKSDELARELLWESAMQCHVQFCRDPLSVIKEFCAGNLRCRVMCAIAEKNISDARIWKTPQEKVRAQELNSELFILLGSPLPETLINTIELPMPGAIVPEDIPAAVPVSKDPAEALQIAGAIYLMPDEIRRQKLADPTFEEKGILQEILFLAGSYALFTDLRQLMLAEKEYQSEPSDENLLRYRKWYYRTILDISRMPDQRGTDNDRNFINSMLLLQEGF